MGLLSFLLLCLVIDSMVINYMCLTMTNCFSVVIVFVLRYYVHFNMKEIMKSEKEFIRLKKKTENWWWEPLIDPKYYELHKWRKSFVWLISTIRNSGSHLYHQYNFFRQLFPYLKCNNRQCTVCIICEK